MNVTLTTQTQYSTPNISNNKAENTSAYDEIAEKKQPSRYEMLLAMNFDNMSEVEKSELMYYHSMRPVSYLDEEGNKALNEALQGKTDTEKWTIKNTMELIFMTSVKSNAQGGIDRQKFDSIDTSKDATVSRFEKYIQMAKAHGNVDNIGLIDVMDKFLGIYNKTPSDIKNQEDSVVDDFFEDLYSKESINFTSSITKQNIKEQVKEYSAFLEQELGNSDEAKNIMANLMTEYKTALMNELKKSIDSTGSTTQEKQSAIKVIVDEKKDENKSSLETLIATENDVKKSNDITQKDDGHGLPTVEDLLDEEGMAQLNKTLDGMPEQDQIMIKLMLSFQLSIKSENVVNAKLAIEWETGKLDSQSILEKLELMVAKRKDRIDVNPSLTKKIDYVVDELKAFYTDKSEVSTNSINKEPTQSGANYYMQNLDKRGNEIVNNLISGKTDTEKFAIKSIMDRQLNFKNTQAYAMAVDAFNEHNNSDIQVSIQPDGFKNKETFLDNLDEFIERQSKGIDNLGILEVAIQLRREYQK